MFDRALGLTPGSFFVAWLGFGVESVIFADLKGEHYEYQCGEELPFG